MEEDERDTLPPSPTTSPLEAATKLTDRVTRRWAAQPRGAARAFPIPKGPEDLVAWNRVIACYIGGDIYAFHLLVKDQRETLLEYADPARLGPGDADDVVSQSLFKLWEEHEKFVGDIQKFRAWSRTMVQIHVLEVRERRGRRQMTDLPTDDTPEALRSADAIAALEHNDTLRFILDHLGKLSELQQRVVRLLLEGHDWETIAQYCSDAEGRPVTVKAAQARVNLAVNNLRGLLEMTKDKDTVYGGITPGIWLRGIVCAVTADSEGEDLLSRIYWDDVDERAAAEGRDRLRSS